MDGLLLIDKPSGWTSFDVVAKVRNILNNYQKNDDRQRNDNLGDSNNKSRIKVGHTGTLDPLATGLLILTIGSYCKRASEFSKLDKTYEVTLKLGETSTTGDAEGEISPFPRTVLGNKSAGVVEMDISDEKPSLEALETAINGFIGEIDQIPPAFSAIKVNGQRAYKLARAGKEVKLEPRKVTIYDITDVKYSYPELKFTTKVSSGTYIRSLVEDIGQNLGTGAYMTALRRTEIGNFELNKSQAITEIDLSQLLTK